MQQITNQNQHEIDEKQQVKSDTLPQTKQEKKEISALRAMQWFYLILVSLWVFAAMVIPIVAFCLTNNPLCLSCLTTLAPPVYIHYRITRYLFQRDQDYEIQKIKAQQPKWRNVSQPRKGKEEVKMIQRRE